MVNLAICSLEGSSQKALLMASLSSLTKTQDKETGLSTLKDTVKQNNEEVEVKFLDVSSDKLNTLMYNAFDIDMFVLVVEKGDLEPDTELDILLEEIAENVPKASLILVEDLKRKVSLRSRYQRPIIVKAASPMIQRKSGSGVNEYHVKCNIANPKEVFQFIATLVHESPSESSPTESQDKKESSRITENRDENDIGIPLLPLDLRSSNSFLGDRQRRIGQVGRPVSCKNKKNSLLPCNCKDLRLRANSDDIHVSNQIVRMADKCAEEFLSQEYIRKLRETKMSLSLLAIILCHPHTLGPSKDPLCGPQCIDTGYVGENFLHILAKRNNFDKIYNLLESSYAPVGQELARMKTKEGYTPLTVAIRMGHTELASYLIKHLLRTSSKDQLEGLLLTKNIHGNNLFNSCCRNDRARLLDLFLVAGIVPHQFLGRALANPSGERAQNPGLTPLMYKTVPEDIILKFWPILLAHDGRKRVRQKCLKGRSYGHIFAAKNCSLALKLFVRDATKYSEGETAVSLLSELDNKENSVFTTAAVYNAKEALILALGYLIAEGTLKDKENVMHKKNFLGQTLLEIVLCQKSDLLVPRHMILGIEGEIHENFYDVSQCFRDNLNLQTSSEVHNTLQFMKEYLPKDGPAMFAKKLLIFLETFFVPFIVMMFDIVTDILLVVSYAYKVLWPDSTIDALRLQHQTTENYTTTFATTATITTATTVAVLDDSSLPLSYEKRLIYSATFLALPWLFYLIEFARSPLRQSRTAKLIRGTSDDNKRGASLKSCLQWVYLLIRSFVLLMFWPIAQLLVKLVHRLKYETSKGREKIVAQKSWVEAQVTGARAHLIEVAVEATFQPLLQMYLLLPIIIEVFNKDFGSIDLDAFKKMDLLQLLSMLASIVSLAWSFAFYKASLKNEALDFDINPFGRIILIFANLSMVTSRLTAFVVFAYCFPDGHQFLALLSCLLAHTLFMSLLHLCFCLLPTSLKRQLDLQLVVDCILNGLANIYTHQWVSVPHHHQKENCPARPTSTWVRQTVFEGILLAESLSIMLAAKFLPLPNFYQGNQDFHQGNENLQLAIVLGLNLLALLFKLIYYSLFHTWSALNISCSCSETKSDYAQQSNSNLNINNH